MTSKSQEALSCSGSSPAALCREATRLLEEAFAMPPNQMQSEFEEIERQVARLRNCLIQRLRAEPRSSGPSRWRKPLEEANVALSLIAGVEYPATGIHRSYMEEAHKVLQDLHGHLAEEG